jgi:hypothetical protein
MTPGVRPNPTVATPEPIAAGGGQEDRSTDIYTYNTIVGFDGSQTPILYNGDRNWAKVTLVLDTAGPVVVGNRADIAPIFSGKGWTLTTGEPIEFIIAKGTRIYVFSSAVNRVKVQVAPLPWLEKITALSAGILSQIGRK